MGYDFGLTNYILHELGSNLEDSNSAVKNEEKIFKKLSESERIDKELNKIKKEYNKNGFSLKENEIINKALKCKDNIKEIIVCLDLVMQIEVSFKIVYLAVIKDILNNEKLIKLAHNEEFDPIVMDNALHNCIFEYLTNIVNS